MTRVILPCGFSITSNPSFNNAFLALYKFRFTIFRAESLGKLEFGIVPLFSDQRTLILNLDDFLLLFTSLPFLLLMSYPLMKKKKKITAKKRKPIKYSVFDFEIKDSTVPGIGKGLFTKQKLYKGDTIGYYTGRIISDDDAESPKYIDSKYLLYICKDWWIYGEGRESNYTRYINHSDKPNALLVTSVRWKTARFEVLKPIPEGGEIFFDYGKDYWDNVDFKPV